MVVRFQAQANFQYGPCCLLKRCSVLKEVKIDSKISNSLCESKSVTHSVECFFKLQNHPKMYLNICREWWSLEKLKVSRTDILQLIEHSFCYHHLRTKSTLSSSKLALRSFPLLSLSLSLTHTHTVFHTHTYTYTHNTSTHSLSLSLTLSFSPSKAKSQKIARVLNLPRAQQLYLNTLGIWTTPSKTLAL